MSEFKSATIRYCNNFQEGKCRFGDKCKYEHKRNPDFKKKEIFGDDRLKKKLQILLQIKRIINFNLRRKILILSDLILLSLDRIEMLT